MPSPSTTRPTPCASPAGIELDFGATAKALAVDRAAEAAAEISGRGVLISLGGDIAVAGPPPADGWSVRVTDDHAAGLDAPGIDVAIFSGASGHVEHDGASLATRWRGLPPRRSIRRPVFPPVVRGAR